MCVCNSSQSSLPGSKQLADIKRLSTAVFYGWMGVHGMQVCDASKLILVRCSLCARHIVMCFREKVSMTHMVKLYCKCISSHHLLTMVFH